MKICLDTNIIIYYVENIEPQTGKVEKILHSFMRGEDEGVISAITVAEVLTGIYKSEDASNPDKAKKTAEWFNS